MDLPQRWEKGIHAKLGESLAEIPAEDIIESFNCKKTNLASLLF